MRRLIVAQVHAHDALIELVERHQRQNMARFGEIDYTEEDLFVTEEALYEQAGLVKLFLEQGKDVDGNGNTVAPEPYRASA